MSDNSKYQESLNELFRYRNNKMSDKERYEFEKALERDPFLAEALDGFMEFRTSDIEHDLKSIDFIAGKRRRSSGMMTYLSIAASVLIIISVSWFLFIKESPDSTSLEVAKESMSYEEEFLFQEDSVEEIAGLVASDSTLLDSLVFDNAPLLAENRAKSEVSEKKKTILKEADKETDERTDSRIEPKGKVEKEERPVPLMAAARSIETEDSVPPEEDGEIMPELQGRIDEIDDTVSDSVAEKLLSMNEFGGEAIPVSDNAVAVEDTALEIRPGVDADPDPLGGMDLFDEYLENNLQYPDSVEKRSREVVRLTFKVMTNGEVTDFDIEKSPENSAYAKEAIRVIKDGPKWSPAVKDGIPVEDRVSLRIIFKP